jgi:hypothetical protein
MQQLFEELVQEARGALDEKVRSMKERLSELQAFCAELRSKMDAVQLNNGEVGPDRPVNEAAGEKVLGVMSENLRRFYLVRRQMLAETKAECQKVHGELEDILTKTPLDKVNEKLSEISADHNKIHERKEFLDNLFWIAVAKEFPNGKANGDLGICKDWQVVTVPVRESSLIFAGPPIIVSAEGLGHLFANMMG